MCYLSHVESKPAFLNPIPTEESRASSQYTVVEMTEHLATRIPTVPIQPNSTDLNDKKFVSITKRPLEEVGEESPAKRFKIFIPPHRIFVPHQQRKKDNYYVNFAEFKKFTDNWDKSPHPEALLIHHNPKLTSAFKVNNSLVDNFSQPMIKTYHVVNKAPHRVALVVSNSPHRVDPVVNRVDQVVSNAPHRINNFYQAKIHTEKKPEHPQKSSECLNETQFMNELELNTPYTTDDLKKKFHVYIKNKRNRDKRLEAILIEIVNNLWKKGFIKSYSKGEYTLVEKANVNFLVTENQSDLTPKPKFISVSKNFLNEPQVIDELEVNQVYSFEYFVDKFDAKDYPRRQNLIGRIFNLRKKGFFEGLEQGYYKLLKKPNYLI